MMKKYRFRMKECETALSREPFIKVQIKKFGIWITIKTFSDFDHNYNRLCAEELMEELTENS